MRAENNIITRARRATVISALALASAAVLAGCTNAQPAPSSGPEQTASSTPAATVAQGTPQETGLKGFTVVDPWVKATSSDMTGMFGELRNDTDAPLQIQSVTVDGVGMVEQHETVVKQDGSSSMQPVAKGFTIPAHGAFTLKPGGNHIMLMQMTKPVQPGDSVTARITFATGQKAELHATAKEYTAAREHYAPGQSATPGASAAPQDAHAGHHS